MKEMLRKVPIRGTAVKYFFYVGIIMKNFDHVVFPLALLGRVNLLVRAADASIQLIPAKHGDFYAMDVFSQFRDAMTSSSDPSRRLVKQTLT